MKTVTRYLVVKLRIQVDSDDPAVVDEAVNYVSGELDYNVSFDDKTDDEVAAKITNTEVIGILNENPT